jgi:hypothetical protein
VVLRGSRGAVGLVHISVARSKPPFSEGFLLMTANRARLTLDGPTSRI